MLLDKISHAVPAENEKLEVNPPVFRWPQGEHYGQAYAVQYSQDPGFADAETVTGIDRLFFRPDRPVAPGKWYWRFRTENNDWSAPLSFSVPDKAALYPTPSWEAMREAVPAEHPRLWVRPDGITALQRRNSAGDPARLIAEWVAELEEHVGQPFPLAEDKPRRTTPTDEERVLQVIAAKQDAMDSMRPAGEMAFVSLLAPGHADLEEEALRRARAAVQLDPHGYTSHDVSDFANGMILGNLALVYDYLFHKLSEADKEAFRTAIVARIQAMYAAFRPRLEIRPIALHPWQHTFADFLAGVLAIYREVPAAEEWLRWTLDMHAAFYPWWGGKDGGSAEGPQYMFATGLVSSQMLAALIKTATGLDLMRHPWFAGNAYYATYAHPPGHLRSQFSDRHPNHYPELEVAVVMNNYAKHFHNPFAREYAVQVEQATETGEAETRVKSTARMLRLLSDTDGVPAPKPLSQLSKSRAFYDIGVAIMHSHIEEASENIMFEFKSSPYGSLGHAHADQNSFNILAFGEELVVDSGYYTSYKDAHHSGWTVTTKAHNTLLIGGKGQGERQIKAAGQLIENYAGRLFHYTVGSAASAYRGVEVKEFLRHALWVAPQAYVVFDQVETAQPVDTQWLLHTRYPMTYKEGWIHSQAKKAQLNAFMAYPDTATAAVTDQFSHPPVKWRPNHADKEFPNQWHLTLSTAQPANHHHWLAVLFVDKAEQACRYQVERLQGDGWVGAGWQQSGNSVVLGSRVAKGAGMKLAEMETDGNILSVVRQEDGTQTVFFANATTVKRQGETLLNTSSPTTGELEIKC